MTTWFVDDASVAPIVSFCRSRAVGAGVDPFEYETLTAGLATLRDWLPVFAAAGRAHGDAAEAAEAAGWPVSAAAAWRRAAACAHIANTLPNPDTDAAVASDRYATAALRRHLRLRGPVVDLAGPDFTGELRGPSGAADGDEPPVAVIVPGLDSGRAEFLDVADALVARGVAVATFDGPGQGELADRPPRAAYGAVISAVIDALAAAGARRVGLVGLSLGGLYAMLGAADPRVSAIATVSGAYPMPPWADLPAFAIDTLTLRCGGAAAAERFTADLDRPGLPAEVRPPMLVVSGAADTMPTPEQARTTATRAPAGESLLIEGGDHLLGNTRWQWLDRTADWLVERLM